MWKRIKISSCIVKRKNHFLQLKMAQTTNQKDDDESVNDSSYLRSGDNNCSQIDYKYASKGPQIKAAIAGS